MDLLETIDISTFDTPVSEKIKETAVSALEKGKVIFLPKLSFPLNDDELFFLTPDIVDPKSKNVSYDIRTDRLAGTLCSGLEGAKLKEMIKRYALYSKAFMLSLFPTYQKHLIQARTSFRPVETESRIQSYKKDDTRLHVDAFPSAPTKDKRILRIFTNVNPSGKPRLWRLGEPFADVVKKMGTRTSKPFPGSRFLMQKLKITKDYRTLYDHYMLQIHDRMKEDLGYQKTAPQQEIFFPAGSSWIVYSDQVSHAAMSGQHLLEQTFHLPVSGMLNPLNSPLKVLENYYNQSLMS